MDQADKSSRQFPQEMKCLEEAAGLHRFYKCRVFRASKFSHAGQALFFDEQYASRCKRHQKSRHRHGLTIIQIAGLRQKIINGNGNGRIIGTRQQQSRAELAK